MFCVRFRGGLLLCFMVKSRSESCLICACGGFYVFSVTNESNSVDGWKTSLFIVCGRTARSFQASKKKLHGSLCFYVGPLVKYCCVLGVWGSQPRGGAVCSFFHDIFLSCSEVGSEAGCWQPAQSVSSTGYERTSSVPHAVRQTGGRSVAVGCGSMQPRRHRWLWGECSTTNNGCESPDTQSNEITTRWRKAS